jgi:hypothetical protein
MDIVDQSDSECVSSVSSDEVLSSYYPVKPRKTLKTSHSVDNSKMSSADGRGQSGSGSNVMETEPINDDMAVEETLNFLTCVETNRRDIYEAEKTREILEIRYQVP